MNYVRITDLKSPPDHNSKAKERIMNHIATNEFTLLLFFANFTPKKCALIYLQ